MTQTSPSPRTPSARSRPTCGALQRSIAIRVCLNLLLWHAPNAHYWVSGRDAEVLLHARGSSLSQLRPLPDLDLLKVAPFMCAGLVTDFEEKPSAERLQQLQGVSRNATGEDPYEASMGIYMFKREVLSRLLDRHRAGNNSKPDAHFGYDVIPHALEDGLRIFAHHHPGYWRVSALLCLLWTWKLASCIGKNTKIPP